MKTQIESTVKWINNEDVARTFNNILDACIYSPNEEALRKNMKPFQDSIHFAYGFGSNHMWVKQRRMGNDQELYNERTLFVEF